MNKFRIESFEYGKLYQIKYKDREWLANRIF